MLKISTTLFTALMASLCYLPIYTHAESPSTSLQPSVEAQASTAELPLKELRLFTLIFDHIRRSYVEPISDQQLLENAIKGMLGEMDPHSAYLDHTAFEQLQESTQGEFSGVGIEMGSEGGFVKVISPIDDTPAQKAGLQAGDIIIKVDQESIQGLSVNEVSLKIRGPIGSSVVFTLLRKGIEQPIDITVVRDTIKSLSVRSKLIEDQIGYIRISQFQSDTGKEFVKAVKTLRAEQPNLTGFILDLRNNPGGILQASVEVVDSLINEGTAQKIAIFSIVLPKGTMLLAYRLWYWSIAVPPPPQKLLLAHFKIIKERSSWAHEPSARARYKLFCP
jgi:carboxyl-terminal processing protease